MNPMQMMQEFFKFKKQFEGEHPNTDPQQYIQQMMNSGRVNPQAFEKARAMAEMFGFKL